MQDLRNSMGSNMAEGAAVRSCLSLAVLGSFFVCREADLPHFLLGDQVKRGFYNADQVKLRSIMLSL